MNIKPLCIYLTETEEWRDEHAKAVEYFNAHGLDVKWMRGVHSKWGIQGNHIYLLDNRPEEQFYIGHGKVCQYLSFMMLYRMMDVMDYDAFLVLESDVVFEPNWKERLEQALKDVPEDWDFLFAASCCAADKEPVHVKGDVYHYPYRGEDKWSYYPQCAHMMLVRKKAVQKVIETQGDVASPVDISLIKHTFQYLNIYAVLPRLATQGTKTHLPE